MLMVMYILSHRHTYYLTDEYMFCIDFIIGKCTPVLTVFMYWSFIHFWSNLSYHNIIISYHNIIS